MLHAVIEQQLGAGFDGHRRRSADPSFLQYYNVHHIQPPAKLFLPTKKITFFYHTQSPGPGYLQLEGRQGW